MRVPRWLVVFGLRWRSLARRAEVERDLHDELSDHIERRAAQHAARGAPADEALRRARLELGGVDQVKERCRDARGVGLAETVMHDVRYGARALVRDRGFSIVAMLTLALGIGANTAVFSLVDGILVAPLPYPAPDRLVSVTGSYPQGAFAAMRREVRTFAPAGYVEGQRVVLKGAGQPARLVATRVTAELFSVLGAAPALGRTLRTGEDEAERDRVVILGHALWRRQFGGDARVVGRFIEIDGVRREVIGVMPASFRFPSARTELWLPLGLDERETARYWGGDYMPVIGRLGDGQAMAGARAEIGAFQQRVLQYFPWRMPPDWNREVSLVPLQDALVGPVRHRLWILMAAVLVVLVTACANVANLSLSRAIGRQREIAVRVAIGAGPRRIAGQLLTESVMLSLAAAAVGVLFSTQVLSLLKHVLPADTPRLLDVQLNWRALAFAGVIAVVTGCAFGIAPVVQSLRLRLRGALEAGGRSGGPAIAGRWRNALTVAQVASAVLLVVAAGLLVRSLWSLARTDPGFQIEGVLALSIAPPESVCADGARCTAFYRALEARVSGAPGIAGAAFVNTLPLTGAIAKRSLQLEGYTPPDGGAPLFWLHAVTPDYFRVMDIRLLAGRPLADRDRTGPGVALVSASTARRFWPEGGAIGRQVRFVGEQEWREVVGVVADVRGHDLGRSHPEWIDGVVYVPYGPQSTLEDGRVPSEMALALRTSLDPRQAAAAVRSASAALGGDIIVGDAQPMQAIVAEAVAAPAAVASLLATMAGVALALGTIGVYGVLSFLVARQIRDFAIRMALGATPRALCWQVLRHGGTLCLIGTVVGLAGAVVLMRWLASELHGVTPTDPATYAAVVAAVSAVTLIACYVPTRRAMRVDPLSALREP